MSIVQTVGQTVARVDLIPKYDAFNPEPFGFIADQIFPTQVVSADSGNFGYMTAKDALQRVDTRRAPGTPSVELSFGVSTDSYQILDYSAKEFCDDIMQYRFGGWLNQQGVATVQIRAAILRDKEWRASRLVQDTVTFATQAASALWSSVGSANAFLDFSTAKESFLKKFGVLPNTAIMGYGLKLKLCLATQIRQALTANYGPTLPAEIPNAALAKVLGGEAPMNIITPFATYDAANPGQVLSASYIWDNTMCVLTYIAPGGTQAGIPTMGECLVRDEGGAGVAIESWRTPDPAGTYVKCSTRHVLKMNPQAPVLIITGCQ